MGRHAAGIARAFALAAVVVACSGERILEPAILPVDGVIAVDFRTDQVQYRIGSAAKTTMVNRSSGTLTMGVCNDVLERAVGSGWAEIPPGNIACIELAVIVPPGDSVTLALDLRLANAVGTYRVRRHFWAATTGKTDTMYRRTNTFAMVR